MGEGVVEAEAEYLRGGTEAGRQVARPRQKETGKARRERGEVKGTGGTGANGRREGITTP